MLIKLENPRPPADQSLEIHDVEIVRLTPEQVGIQFVAVGGVGPGITMPQQVFDKLTLAVVQFVQTEAVAKAQAEVANKIQTKEVKPQ